jgi:hypothetical protein
LSVPVSAWRESDAFTLGSGQSRVHSETSKACIAMHREACGYKRDISEGVEHGHVWLTRVRWSNSIANKAVSDYVRPATTSLFLNLPVVTGLRAATGISLDNSVLLDKAQHVA